MLKLRESNSSLNYNATPYEPSFTRDFIEGFRYAPESNLSAPSSWLGAVGLSMSQYEGLLSKTAKVAPIQYANISSKGLKYLKPAGKFLGGLGAVLTAVEGASDGNGFTTGDMVKVGISVVTIFTPYGWVYSAVDLGVGIATGTTLTDRIGAGIDNTILGR